MRQLKSRGLAGLFIPAADIVNYLEFVEAMSAVLKRAGTDIRLFTKLRICTKA